MIIIWNANRFCTIFVLSPPHPTNYKRFVIFRIEGVGNFATDAFTNTNARKLATPINPDGYSPPLIKYRSSSINPFSHVTRATCNRIYLTQWNGNSNFDLHTFNDKICSIHQSGMRYVIIALNITLEANWERVKRRMTGPVCCACCFIVRCLIHTMSMHNVYVILIIISQEKFILFNCTVSISIRNIN